MSVAIYVCALCIGLGAQSPSAPAGASDRGSAAPQSAPASPAPPDDGTPSDDGTRSSEPANEPAPGHHMFGIFPNYATVEARTDIPPIGSREKFRLAWLNSFDRDVFPYVAVVAGITMDYGRGLSGYAKQYGASFADNAAGSFMTTAIVASLARQDPRYFQRGSGSILHRVAYAASRNLITRADSGREQFNVSELGGNALAAGLSDVCYPARERTVSATATRWGVQLFVDALSNEAKEFWPDIHRKFRRR